MKIGLFSGSTNFHLCFPSDSINDKGPRRAILAKYTVFLPSWRPFLKDFEFGGGNHRRFCGRSFRKANTCGMAQKLFTLASIQPRTESGFSNPPLLRGSGPDSPLSFERRAGFPTRLCSEAADQKVRSPLNGERVFQPAFAQKQRTRKSALL